MKVKPYVLTNDKKTYSEHNAFIFNMNMKINKKNNYCNKNKTVEIYRRDT